MIKMTVFHSIYSKLVFWALLFTVPIIGLLTAGILIAMNSFEQQLTLSHQQLLLPYASEIEVTLENIHSYVANRTVPTQFLSKIESGSELEQLQAMQDLNAYYSEDIYTYSQIDGIFVLHNEKFRFIRNRDRDYSKQCQAAQYIQDFLCSLTAEENPFRQGYQAFMLDGDPYLMLTQRSGNTLWGCWIHTQQLLSAIRNQEIDGLTSLFLEDENNIWKYETSETSSPLIIRQSFYKNAFFLTAVLDRSELFSVFHQLRLVLFFLIAFAILLFFLYLSVLVTLLIRPLQVLVTQMNRIKSGDFSEYTIAENTALELREVYTAMNAMTREIDHLKIGIYEQKLPEQEAKLQLLQLQVKPHFILNGLNTIMGFAQSHDFEMTQKMTFFLSRHFRYLLYQEHMVSLAEELEHIKNYLEIHRMKHQTVFSYIINVPEELYETEIPILSLQTFVENSLKYARTSEIKITITGQLIKKQETDFLMLQVTDNGVGFSEELLSQLPHPEKGLLSRKNAGIGMYNVNQRLTILYHGRARLHVANQKQGGAQITILLPFSENT